MSGKIIDNGDIRYTNPGLLNERTRQDVMFQQRLDAMDDEQAKSLVQAAQNAPAGATPDAVAAAWQTGGSAGTVDKLSAFQKQVAAKAAQDRAAAAREADRAKYESEFHFWDDVIVDPLKGVSRVGFSTISAPYEIVNNAIRAYSGAVTGDQAQDVSWTDVFQTDLGSMATLWSKGNFDTGGEGFFVDEKSQVGQMTDKYTKGLWAETDANGLVVNEMTSGKGSADLMGIQRGTSQYALASGVADFGFSLVQDPTVWLGLGVVGKAGTGLSGLEKIAKGLGAADQSKGAALAKGAAEGARALEAERNAAAGQDALKATERAQQAAGELRAATARPGELMREGIAETERIRQQAAADVAGILDDAVKAEGAARARGAAAVEATQTKIVDLVKTWGVDAKQAQDLLNDAHAQAAARLRIAETTGDVAARDALAQAEMFLRETRDAFEGGYGAAVNANADAAYLSVRAQTMQAENLAEIKSVETGILELEKRTPAIDEMSNWVDQWSKARDNQARALENLGGVNATGPEADMVRDILASYDEILNTATSRLDSMSTKDVRKTIAEMRAKATELEARTAAATRDADTAAAQADEANAVADVAEADYRAAQDLAAEQADVTAAADQVAAEAAVKDAERVNKAEVRAAEQIGRDVNRANADEMGRLVKDRDVNIPRQVEREVATATRDAAKAEAKTLSKAQRAVRAHLKTVAEQIDVARKEADRLRQTTPRLEAEAQQRLDLLAQARGAEAAAAAARSGDLGPLREFVREQHGISRVTGLDANKFLGSLLGGSGKKITEALVELTDPLVILERSNGKIPLEYAKRLANASSVDEVVDVLAKGVGAGDISKTSSSGRAWALTASAKVNRLSAPGNAEANLLARMEGAVMKPLLRAYDMNQRIVPWAYRLDLNDGDVTYRATRDFLSRALGDTAISRNIFKPGESRETRDFMEKHLRKLIDAEDAEQRGRVIADATAELVDFGLRRKGIDPTLPQNEAIADALRSAAALYATQRNEARRYLAAMERIGKNEHFIAGVNALDSKVPQRASQLTDQMSLPDANELKVLIDRAGSVYDKARRTAKVNRAMAKSTGDADVKRAAGVEAATSWEEKRASRVVANLLESGFDKIWRTAVLAFRVSYIIRNIAEMQFRMWLKGHTVGPLHPMRTLAMATSGMPREGAWGKLLGSFDTHTDDVLGRNFTEVLTKEELDDIDGLVIDADFQMRAQARRTISTGDTGFSRRLVAHGGEVIYNSKEPAWINGWADDLMIIRADQMDRDMLRVFAGDTPKRINMWASRKGMPQTGPGAAENAAIDFYYNGPGRKDLDRLIAARPDFYGKMFASEAGFAEWVREVKRAELEAVTLGFNPRIVNGLMATTGRDVEKSLAAGQRAAQEFGGGMFAPQSQKDLRATLRAIRDEKAKIGEELNFGVLRRRTDSTNGTGARALDRVEQWTDSFFHYSAIMEGALAYTPEIRLAYWDKVAELAAHVDPKDAQRLLDNADKALGKVTKTVGGKKIRIGAEHPAHTALKRAQKNSTDGNLSLEEIHNIAAKHAAKEAQDLFYEAHKRKQTWYALRLVSPFGQAWSNTMVKWGRLAAADVQKPYVLAKGYQAFTANGEPQPDLSTPMEQRSTIYTDPQTGQLSIRLPLIGEALGTLAGVSSGGLFGGTPVTDGGDAFAMNMPLSSLNLAFGSGVPAPGAGPAISLPVKTLANQAWFNDASISWLADPLKTWADPFPSGNAESGIKGVYNAMAPAWARRIVAAFDPEWGEQEMASVTPALANWLLTAHPERYTNEAGRIDQIKLVDDARGMARATSMYRGFFQSGFPGSAIPEYQVRTKDGNHPAQAAIMEHFNDLRDTKYPTDPGAAVAEMQDIYGRDIVLTLTSNYKRNVYPSSGAFALLQSEPEMAEYADVLSTFYPEAGFSVAYDKWLRRKGLRENASVGDKAADANNLIYQARKSVLEDKVGRGEMTQDQMDKILANEAEEFGLRYQMNGTGPDTKTRIQMMEDALSKSQTLASTRAGQAVLMYMGARDQALSIAEARGYKGLSGKNMADVAAALKKFGEDLAVQEPEFSKAWQFTFSGEVSQ